MWSFSDFDVGQKLGEGRFTRVYLAKQRRDLVALKIVNKQGATRNQCRRFVDRELRIHSRLKHPNIVQLHAYFWDDSSIYLVLEYAALGTLYGLLQKRTVGTTAAPAKNISEDVPTYTDQVVAALSYLHERHIIYRDLKTCNVLLFHGKIAKLADFGTAVHAPEPHASRRKTFLGTPPFWAPEMISQPDYDFRVDLWMLGLLVYELLFGLLPVGYVVAGGPRAGAGGEQDTPKPEAGPPRAEEDMFKVYKQILSLDADRLFGEGCGRVSGAGGGIGKQEGLVSLGEDFVKGLLRQKPEDRRCLGDCAGHSFVLKGKR